MVKLKAILGKGPSRPASSVGRPMELAQSNKRKALSEGFAMGRNAEAENDIPANPAYSGPRPYGRGSLDKALRLAGGSADACAEALICDIDAESSKASIKSLQNTWERIASQAGFSNPFQLTPNLVFCVVGVLKAAEYRSAANYLEAAKRKHISMGHVMSDQLKQACRQAIRSAKRDLGPAKQAEPIPLPSMAAIKSREAADPEGPLAPGRSTLLASWWLLREIEASHARVSHVSFDWSKKEVSLKLPNSKTDFMALGTSRSHSCSCTVSTPQMCPYHGMMAHVAFAKSIAGNREGWLFPTSEGQKPTKSGWCKTFMEVADRSGIIGYWDNGAPKFTGHTARASGAHHLAQAGVDLWRVQIFGRWSSAAFLRYVRSAPLASLSSLATESSLTNSIAAARLELQALAAQPGAPQLEDPKELVPVNHDMIVEATPVKVIPPAVREFVQNTASCGKFHEVLVKGDSIHPREWRTRCGWYFGRGLTTYSLQNSEPSEARCKVCFPEARCETTSDSSTSSDSSSS